MKFEIKAIKPTMSHEEKVYEYSRRIAFYLYHAKLEREQSKVFDCADLDVNKKVVGGFYDGEPTGCLKNEWKPVCEACNKAAIHYDKYREHTRKKATAIRQLSKELSMVISKYEV
jgi:hypothetical protein